MARKLVVYGGTIFHNGIQVRAIVACTTKKRACELLNVPLSTLNDYFSQTHNANEISIATKSPDTVFICGDRYRSNPTYQERDAAL